jgi:hypothetical protein
MLKLPLSQQGVTYGFRGDVSGSKRAAPFEIIGGRLKFMWADRRYERPGGAALTTPRKQGKPHFLLSRDTAFVVRLPAEVWQGLVPRLDVLLWFYRFSLSHGECRQEVTALSMVQSTYVQYCLLQAPPF